MTAFIPRLAMLADAISIKTLALPLAIIAATALGAATGHTQPFARTFVSNTGVDTDNFNCDVNTPCLTFQHALGETSSGGEINCLNAGGFGAVTIGISVTIDCEGASNGGIQTSGTNAITISTGGIIVNLIGLDINGENASGGIGVNITAAATVNIRHCKIYGFLNSVGLTGYGIYFSPVSSGGTLVVDNVFLANNTYSIFLNSTNGESNMTVRNSTITNNIYGIFLDMNGGTHAGVTIEQTTLAFNSPTGLAVRGSGAVAVIGGSTVVNNTTGIFNNGGTIYSFKNNQIGGNGTDGTPLTAYPGGPLN